MNVEVILEPQEEGGFVVHAPSIKGCWSQSETREEALANIKEAIELMLEPDLNESIEFNGEKVVVKV